MIWSLDTELSLDDFQYLSMEIKPVISLSFYDVISDVITP